MEVGGLFVTGLGRVTLGSVMLVALALFGGVDGARAAHAGSGDQRTARTLVVARVDAPSGWSSHGVLNPCTAQRTGVAISGRATSSWTGLGGHVWSVALVAPTVAEAKRLYHQVSIQIPPCLVRFWRKSSPPEAVVTLRAVPATEQFGDATRSWQIITRGGDPRISVLHIVAVRVGRAVAYYAYVLSPPDVLSRQGTGIPYAIRRAVHRAE